MPGTISRLNKVSLSIGLRMKDIYSTQFFFRIVFNVEFSFMLQLILFSLPFLHFLRVFFPFGYETHGQLQLRKSKVLEHKLFCDQWTQCWNSKEKKHECWWSDDYNIDLASVRKLCNHATHAVRQSQITLTLLLCEYSITVQKSWLITQLNYIQFKT